MYLKFHGTHALEGVLFPIRLLQLFQNNASFVAIGSAKSEQLNAFVCLKAIGTIAGRHGSGGSVLFSNRFGDDFEEVA